MNRKVMICGVNTSGLPVLSDEQSLELLKRTKKGDKNARNEFIVANTRLVLSLVKRFWAKKANVDDIFQAGCVGLIKSIDNFDVNLGVKFSTYAVPMILGEIKRFLRDGNSLRVSRSIRDTAYKVLKTREMLEKDKTKQASLEEIADNMNVAVSDVVYALDAISDTVSLYDPIYNGEEGFILMDKICDEKNNDERWLEKVAMDNAMKRLDEREKRILKLRYYEGKTQTEISDEVGISQAQVSRIEKSALKTVKRYME